MDTAQWPQEIVVKPMEEIVVPNGTTNTASKPSSSSSSSLERRVKAHQKEEAVNCPRCNSTNTKFCYYNNYSLSQPRYFCKTCRRYWTAGGTLRNIPVGGGSRKNKRSSSSTSSSIPSKKLINLPDLVQASASSHHQNPNSKIYDHGQDLNLGFPSNHDFKTISELIQVPSFDGHTKSNLETPNLNTTTPTTTSTSSNTSHLSALELLTGMTSRGLGLSSFMPMPMPIPDPTNVYSSGFSLPEFKVPSLGFSLDGIGGSNNGYGSLQENGNGGRLLFPFEDLKQVSSTTTAQDQHDDHNVDQSRDHQNGDSNGYWNGMLGGGSW